MEKLAQAIVSEVCLNFGVPLDTPIPAALLANVEGRIKAYFAVTLGICDPSDVLRKMEPSVQIARAQDARKGLTGKWYEGANAKKLG